MKRIKSDCGNYTAVYTDHHSRSYVIDNKTGIIYNDEIVEKNNSFYAQKHGMTGYGAYGKGEKIVGYFTLSFADFKEGMKINPYTGNTIIKEYEAIFKVPKKLKVKRPAATKNRSVVFGGEIA